MAGQISAKKVWKMLEDCAPGYEKHLTRHHWRIRYQGLTYPTFPCGPHGREKGNYQVEAGHVRQLIRHFGLEECADRHFPEL